MNNTEYNLPLLAIETASSYCSVAIRSLDGRTAGRSIKTNRQHNEALPGLVSEVMAEVETSWLEMQGIVVSIGPGSFTGLRVGVSFAKGAALALAIPVIPISTLTLLAESFFDEFPNTQRVLPLLSARKGESFGQKFEKNDTGIVAMEEADLLNNQTIKNILLPKTHLVGEGVLQFDVDALSSQQDIFIHSEFYPSPMTLLRLGEIMFRTNPNLPSVSDIEPLYLKEFTIKIRNTSTTN